MKLKLTEEQQSAVRVLTHRRRALICSKTGSGKSAMVLAAFEYLKSQGKVDRLLVLAPKNSYEKKGWLSECKKHTTFKAMSIDELAAIAETYTLSKLPKYLESCDVIYGKHSHLKNKMSVMKACLAGRTIVCLDETQAFKNPASQLTMLCRYFLTEAFATYGCTATPLSKDMTDAYNILNLIRPGCLGSFDWFRDVVCLSEKVKIRTAHGAREVIKITGVRDQALLDSLIGKFVITGEARLTPNFHKIPYELSPYEMAIYRRIAKGINMSPQAEVKDWIKLVMSSEQEEEPSHIKDIDLHSSRFIYLQYAADGILDDQGLVNRAGTKTQEVLKTIEAIISKKQSCLVYFDFYESLDAVKKQLQFRNDIRVLESSGRKSLKPDDISEATCKKCPHVVLLTRAGAPSTSFYYINNVVMAHIPTVPEVFVQAVGRITRLDTIFDHSDLHVWVPMSSNIDEYKMRLTTSKTTQMESVSGNEKNIPDWFRSQEWNERVIRKLKRQLLWVR